MTVNLWLGYTQYFGFWRKRGALTNTSNHSESGDDDIKAGCVFGIDKEAININRIWIRVTVSVFTIGEISPLFLAQCSLHELSRLPEEVVYPHVFSKYIRIYDFLWIITTRKEHWEMALAALLTGQPGISESLYHHHMHRANASQRGGSYSGATTGQGVLRRCLACRRRPQAQVWARAHGVGV